MNTFTVPRRTQNGVTLMELLVVVAIIGILTGIAYPSYQKSVAKTRRRAAETCLSNYASFMERYYTTNLSYVGAALPAMDCATAANTGANYTYTFTGTPTTTAYTLQAAPKTQQSANDSQCGTLRLNQTGARTVTGTAGATQCW